MDIQNPIQLAPNISKLSNLCKQLHLQQFAPKKNPRDSAQNTALQKKPSTPPFNQAKASASNLHLRIGIVGHVIFISLSLLMFALLVVWVIQQAMPRPGKKKMDFSRPENFSVWRFGDASKMLLVIFFGWDEN